MEELKQKVAAVLASRVKDGEVIGLGSGSTAELAIKAIAKRVADEGLQIAGVPTSHRTAILAAEAGIRVLNSVGAVGIHWAFDGADEIDPEFNMLKGRGAAMLNEKIIARRASSLLIIVSEEKMVPALGTNFAIPLEVIPESLPLVEDELRALGATEVVVRGAEKKYGPVISEHNNLVLDATFKSVPTTLDAQLKCITGVVEHGLFIGFNPEVLVAKRTGVFSLMRENGETRESKVG